MHPLINKRVLITRARHQSSDLAAQLESLGGVCILIPTIEIIPPASWDELDEAVAQLDTFDWLVFTSANAVEVFVQRWEAMLLHRGGRGSPSATWVRTSLEERSGALPRIAAIGPATARAIQSFGFRVELMPPEFVAESLSEVLAPYAPGAKMLYVRAAEARDHLHRTLTAAGAQVRSVEAYRNRIPPDSVSTLQDLFSAPELYPDAITFTSASTVRNLVSLLSSAGFTLPSSILLASIGPITSRELRDAGLQPTVEAAAPTIAALIEAIAIGLV